MSGLLVNLLIQIIGGGVGGQILGMLIPMLANTASTPDIGAMIGQLAGGGVAGTAIVGMLKNRSAA
ncbi:MAG: hypothetical protein V4602_00675 [Pseudomonadota bacterium]